MSSERIRLLKSQFLQTKDKKIDDSEAWQLIYAAEDQSDVDPNELAALNEVLQLQSDQIEPEAAAVLRNFIQSQQPQVSNLPITVVPGRNPNRFEDDLVFLGEDGSVKGTSGVGMPYTRGYLQTASGVLKRANGSPPPPSIFLDEKAHAALKARAPGRQLDLAAKAMGVNAKGFEKLASSKHNFNPDAEGWFGKCHSWAWTSLNNTVNQLVDVEGSPGERGVWLGGSWISRADLGNWMMGLADQIALKEASILEDTSVTAKNLIQGTMQYLTNNGGGMIADIHNDEKEGSIQKWNQPFVAAEISTRSLEQSAQDDLIRLAKTERFEFAAKAKRLSINGEFGVEVGDSHEDKGRTHSKNWNLYAVTDAMGKVLTAYVATDEKLAGFSSLPVRSSPALPDYILKPSLKALDDVLAGRSNKTVEKDENGERFKFFVNYVLQQGVPGHVRTAFEARLSELPVGDLNSEEVATLAKDFPRVANAYSPEQWKTHLAVRGLNAKQFGATWKS